MQPALSEPSRSAEPPPSVSRDPAADYDRVARAIEYLRRHQPDQPSLEDVARAVHLSPFHLQRLFSRWAGLSPKRFLQVLTLDAAKERLAASSDVLSAAHESGLSGAGRLHDLFVELEAVTPGEHRRAGEGLEIRYGYPGSPFGRCLIGQTRRGVCYLEFQHETDRAAMRERLQAAWPAARLVPDEAGAARLARRIFTRHRRDAPLPVLVQGTNFQARVWSALLRIPPGHTATYAQVADWIGHPRATRAVGSAVGANPVAWLIPCHRVLRSDGSLGGYAWGETRKLACLAWEAAAAGSGKP